MPCRTGFPALLRRGVDGDSRCLEKEKFVSVCVERACLQGCLCLYRRRLACICTCRNCRGSKKKREDGRQPDQTRRMSRPCEEQKGKETLQTFLSLSVVSASPEIHGKSEERHGRPSRLPCKGLLAAYTLLWVSLHVWHDFFFLFHSTCPCTCI